MAESVSAFDDFFERATGKRPYPYQKKLAESPVASRIISVPTGAGKTAAVILAWLYQRYRAPETTPRRLVYCLPMRVLVEQTRDLASQWVSRIDKIWPQVGAGVYTLMGAEVEEGWEVFPERPAILVGTQDMLLSRALNRGYAMSRYKWPVHFGLLNNDCLWVCDEIQLMGSGLGTTTQLQAWREQFGLVGPAHTWWMSATMDRSWLGTVDFAARAADLDLLTLGPADLNDRLRKRYTAAKPLNRLDESKESKLALRILDEHRPGTLTLAVLNTVDRAQRLFEEITKAGRKKRGPTAEVVLVHSRFRPADRVAIMDSIQAPAGADGRIVVATQVVEAGVDLSARTLFTDLAPWSSIVQRVGRCNRAGEYSGEAAARVFWIDVGEKQAKPYDPQDLAETRERLAALNDVSIPNLEGAGVVGAAKLASVIRKKDLLDLFDTTPDLSGADVDVSRFIRDGDDLDVQVFWREFSTGDRPDPKWSPRREELCPVPCYAVAEFLGNSDRTAYRWDALEGRWSRAFAASVRPGEVYLVACRDGGYSQQTGWNSKLTEPVAEIPAPEHELESYDSDKTSCGAWLTVAQHTDGVVVQVEELIAALKLDDAKAGVLAHAARWHDRGKGHPVFQAALPEDAVHPKGSWAKAPGSFRRYRRPHFRHELASALAILQERLGVIPEECRDLVAYLVAAHHGRIRLSIRSMPNEMPHPTGKRFARGIWEDEDVLAELDLGGGVTAEQVQLSLAPMEMGAEGGCRSWAERILQFRDEPPIGPFRLAYLESLLRAADRRASAEELVKSDA